MPTHNSIPTSAPAVCGTFPENKPTITLRNTPEYNRMNAALPQMAYFRYRDRGSKQPFGDHLDDFRYISPNHHNMIPESPYRHYFHANMSRTYNSLGDATAVFNRNLQAQHHPAQPPSDSSHIASTQPPPSPP